MTNSVGQCFCPPKGNNYKADSSSYHVSSVIIIGQTVIRIYTKNQLLMDYSLMLHKQGVFS